MTTVRLLDFRRSASQRLSGDRRDPPSNKQSFMSEPLIPIASTSPQEQGGLVEVLVLLLGPRAQGRAGTEVTWGGRQHCSPIAFHTVPLPEVQGEDLTVEHRPLREGIWKVGEVAQSSHGDHYAEGALGEK